MYYNKEYHDCNSGDTAQRGCILMSMNTDREEQAGR